jgi:hypothetical protein
MCKKAVYVVADLVELPNDIAEQYARDQAENI